jgi:UDPglucose 6-dehydrogenase
MKNTINNVGIVGQGFVGKAITEKFKETNTVFAYDLDESKRGVFTGKEARYDKELNLTTLVKNSDVVFVCVPTPMFKSGKCDVSIVNDVISDLNEISAELDKDTLVVIKSTVPPGTTESFNKTYSRVGVSFSPEFLTEANSVEDFKNQTRIILGIDWLEYVKPLTSLFETAFPEAKIAVLNTVEAELSKYVTNLFLATKVSFFNDMYKLTEAINRDKTISHDINFDLVTSAALLDPRIGKSHYMVPGPDGDFGYGGICLPKDLAAMLAIADELKTAVPTLLGASTTNSIVRKNRDWELMEGRAVSSNDEIEFINEDSFKDIENIFKDEFQ